MTGFIGMPTMQENIELLLQKIADLEQRVTALEPCIHNEGWTDISPSGNRMSIETCNKCRVVRPRLQ